MSSTTVDVVDNKTGPHGGSEPELAPAAGRFPLRSRWHWRACGQSVRGGVTHALQQAADRSAWRVRRSRPGRTARLSGPTCARELFPSRTCGAPGGPPAPVRNDADCRADGSQRAVSAPPRAASPRGGEGPVRPLTARLPARTPRTPAAGAADARAQARRPQPGRTGQWPRARGGGAGQRWSPWRVPQSTAYTTDTYRPFSKYGRIRGPGRGGWGEGPSENLGDSQPPSRLCRPEPQRPCRSPPARL